MVDGGGGLGGQGPGSSPDDSALDGPGDSIFEVLKPVLVLVGMLAVLFVLLYVFG